MNQNIDDEIIRSCFGDCLFLFYSNVNNNIKSIRMMDEELKLVWDKSFSRTEDWFKSVCEVIDAYVHPEDREVVKYLLNFENYSRLMRTRRNYTLYYRFKKDDEYMVMMGEAWLLATVAIYYPNEVYEYLKDLDDLTLKRKVISKMVDSFRIDETTKERFKGLR